MIDDAEDPTGRALALLSCFTSRPHWSGPELAERLGVTTRTVRRDIDRLRRLGYDIVATSGNDGGYRLRAGATVPPLFLDPDEAIAVVAALLGAAGDGAGLPDASARALAKLHHVLPAGVRSAADAMRDRAQVARLTTAPVVDPGQLAVLATACRDAVGVRFDYGDRAGRRTARRVEPDTLVTVRSAWYLVGYDLDRDDWRVFRVDRIDGAVERTGHGARRRTVPGGDALAFLAASLADAPYKHTVVVEMPRSVDQVLGRLPTLLPSRVERTGRRSCRIRLGATDVAQLTRQLVDVATIAPPTSVTTTDAVADHIATVSAALAALLTRRTAT